MIRILRFFFYSFDNSLLLLLILSLIAGYISPDITWIAPFLSFAFPVLFFLYLGFLIYAFLRKRKWKLKLAILAILSFGFFQNQLRFTPETSSKSGDFKVMGFNARLFDIYNWIDREAWAPWSPRTDNGKVLKGIYGTIKTVDADILCIQEYYFKKKSPYASKDTLRKYGYKHKTLKLLSSDWSHGVQNFYGIATFSKYPIIHSETFGKEEGFQNGALISDIKIKEDTIRVINVHFNSYRLSKNNYETLKQIKNADKDSIQSNDIFSIVYAAKVGINSRWKEIKKIKEMANSSPYPVIISCDLNEAPNTYGYKHLSSNLNDAFLESGIGFGSTMVSPYPLRIDYILSSPELQPFNFSIGKEEISDHYPVWCEYELGNNI